MQLRTFILLALLPLGLCAQRAVVITSLPVNTPAGDMIYLASSANGWNPGDATWTFDVWDGMHVLGIPASAPTTFQGKITRGSWATVEGNATGGFLPDRTFNFSNSDTLYIQVQSWEGAAPPPTDLPPNVVTISDNFFMPELNRSRRIRLFLPSDYDTAQNHYPVLYMHDGQNLFSAQEAFAGEWMVDESMLAFEAQGYPGAIIVAIDHGGSQRINEYTPWANAQYGGGQGADYMAFIVNTLKPYIDSEYRTLPEREHTGIMGSSLGGLISFYGSMAYQQTFSKAGVFSPSFWFNNTVYTFAEAEGKQEDVKFYFLAGALESANLIPQVNQMVGVLLDAGFTQDEVRFDTHPNGQHSEWYWAQQFPIAFEWLFMQSTTGTSAGETIEAPAVYPNPAGERIWLRNNPSSNYNYHLSDLRGRKVLEGVYGSGPLEISTLPSGLYVLHLSGNDGAYTFKIVKH